MYNCVNNVSLWLLNVLKPGITTKQLLLGTNELLIGCILNMNNLLKTHGWELQWSSIYCKQIYEVMEMPFTSQFNVIGSPVQGFGRAYQGR